MLKPKWLAVLNAAAAKAGYGKALPKGHYHGVALIMGYAGVYSSFLKHAFRQAERYQVSGAEILVRAGARKLVGGQEDQLIDIALEIQREEAAAATNHSPVSTG